MADYNELYNRMQASAGDMSAASVEMKSMLTADDNTDVNIDGYGPRASFSKQIKALVEGQPSPPDVVALQELRMTLSDAVAYTHYLAGQVVYITDLGYRYQFVSERQIIPGHAESAITTSDELHKIVSFGGMLEFCDYERLRERETANYTAYLAKLRSFQAIGLVAYGDSITWGLMNISGDQSPKPYPRVIAETLTELTQSTHTQVNLARSGDTTLANYLLTKNNVQPGDVATIMLGVNDIQTATYNGRNPADINGDTLYGVKNYTLMMRKFVAREILRGRCVVVLGTTQYVTLNEGPMGNLTSPYLLRAYDSAAQQVAEEFGCGFVDTRRDIIQQFGVSESNWDGLHPRNDFLEIIGKRFAAFFLQQDYKNPYILQNGSVFIPNYLFNPVSSNRVLQRNLFRDGSSPPFLEAADNPEAVGVMLPNQVEGGNVTLAFYLASDSAVIFPSINSDGSAYSFDLILDNGAKQPDYPSDVDVLLRNRDYILSGKSISGAAKKNRTTENYSQIYTACYLHVTTRGWHTITFKSGQNAGVAAVEGLYCDSWQNVRNNDVYGGVTGNLSKSAEGLVMSGAFTNCTQISTGVYALSTTYLVADNFRVEVECPQDATFILPRVFYRTSDNFRLAFFDAAGNPVEPTAFNLKLVGGK